MKAITISDSETLTLELTGAASTDQPEFLCSYVDSTFGPGSTKGELNSTTPVTIAAAPASGVKRAVHSLFVYNLDTATATMLLKVTGGTTRTVLKYSLAAGEAVEVLAAAALEVAVHGSRHHDGGADPVKLDDLAAPDDNTDLDASTAGHGLLPKLGGGTTNYLRADGTWATPPDTDTVYDGDIDDLDIDGGDDIGDDLADADLIIVDDGAGGTNRKSAMSRLWTYIQSKLTAYKLDDLAAPDDNTDLDASASGHGLFSKLDKIKLDRMENVYAITGTSGNLTADESNGDTQTLSITDTTDLGFTLTSGKGILLKIEMTGSQTVTWNGAGSGDGVDEWDGGTVPTLTADGEDHILVWKIGTTIYGKQVGTDVKAAA